MAKSMAVSALAAVSLVFGILVVVAGVLLVPAFGFESANSKGTLLTIIGSLHLVGGLLFVVSGIGAWRGARWGWTLGIAAAVLAFAGGFWAYITVFNTTLPLATLVVALLVLGFLVAVRSSFRRSESPASGSPPPTQ